MSGYEPGAPGQPQQPQFQQPPPASPGMGYGQYHHGHPPGFPPGYGFQRWYPESSQATTAFVLGMLGFLVFPLFAPFAWMIGNQELAAIREGRRSPENKTMARAGQVLGIIMSVLMLFFVAFIAFIFAFTLIPVFAST